jgi:hypothetical protein
MQEYIEVSANYIQLHHELLFVGLVWNLMLTFGLMVALFKKPPA